MIDIGAVIFTIVVVLAILLIGMASRAVVDKPKPKPKPKDSKKSDSGGKYCQHCGKKI